jgi:hypothetical protein
VGERTTSGNGSVVFGWCPECLNHFFTFSILGLPADADRAGWPAVGVPWVCADWHTGGLFRAFTTQEGLNATADRSSVGSTYKAPPHR